MPLPTHTLNDLPQTHLDDHNGLIKTVVDAFEGTTPASFKAAGVFQTAAQTPFVPTGTVSATQVQNAIVEVAQDAATALAAHEADTTSVHGIADTAALETQVGAQIRVNTHVNDLTAAHAAGSISFNPLSSGLSSTDVNAAIIETKGLIPSGVTGVSSPLGVPLSSFAGANDDARILAYETARKQPGAIHGYPCLLDQPRVYTFTQPLAVGSGFAVVGGLRPVEQVGGAVPVPTQVNLRLTSLGGWLTVPSGLSRGVALVGISFNANSNSRVFQPNASANLTCYTLRDISYENGPGVIGSSSQHMPMTISTIEGFGNWNNIRDRAFNLGGSDCAIDFSRCNLDSNSNFMGPVGYICEFTSMSKAYVKGMYITADIHSGLLVDNSNNYLRFFGCEIEGRRSSVDEPNNVHPCYGALVRDSSSFTQYNQCWFGYAMINPGAGTNAGDLGYVHCTSGSHEFVDCHVRYADANNPASTAVIYATGASTYVYVRNMTGEGNSATVGGTQTNGVRFKPRVRVVGGATADVDSSVTLVTT